MPKAPKEPPVPQPPAPPVQTIQVRCIPWKVMDFQIEAKPVYLTIQDLEEIIKARHGDGIENLVLYKDDPRVEENRIPADSSDTVPSLAIYYDYYPPQDPFKNRPVANEIYSNAEKEVIRATCTEAFVGEPGKGGAWKSTSACTWGNNKQIPAWSKQAEHDPWTARRLAAEAKAKAEAEAEAARLAAEAKEKAEAEAKAKAEAEAAKKAKAKAEKEAKEKAEAEEAAREAEAKAKAEAEAAAAAAAEWAAAHPDEKPPTPPKPKVEYDPSKLPKRAKGGAIGLFLGPTSKTHYGLDKCTKADPYMMITQEAILADIQFKGKTADMYAVKDQVEKYAGEDKELLICIDPAEVYSDEGFVICLTDADKQHFKMSIDSGNGMPPPL